MSILPYLLASASMVLSIISLIEWVMAPFWFAVLVTKLELCNEGEEIRMRVDVRR